jgi:hypothetical protein
MRRSAAVGGDLVIIKPRRRPSNDSSMLASTCSTPGVRHADMDASSFPTPESEYHFSNVGVFLPGYVERVEPPTYQGYKD